MGMESNKTINESHMEKDKDLKNMSTRRRVPTY